MKIAGGGGRGSGDRRGREEEEEVEALNLRFGACQFTLPSLKYVWSELNGTNTSHTTNNLELLSDRRKVSLLKMAHIRSRDRSNLIVHGSKTMRSTRKIIPKVTGANNCKYE